MNSFEIEFHGRRLTWQVGPKSDLEIMHEVLVSGEYADLDIPPPAVILDVGSHIGTSILHFRTEYLHARVIGIEPNPRTFERLRHNVQALPAVDVHRYALAGEDGSLSFFMDHQACKSSLRPSRSGESVNVQGVTLDSLLELLGLRHVDLLKLDIEYGELDALRASKRLPDVTAIVGEFDDGGDPRYRNDFFSLLGDYELRVEGDVGRHTTFLAVRREPGASA